MGSLYYLPSSLVWFEQLVCALVQGLSWRCCLPHHHRLRSSFCRVWAALSGYYVMFLTHNIRVLLTNVLFFWARVHKSFLFCKIKLTFGVFKLYQLWYLIPSQALLPKQSFQPKRLGVISQNNNYIPRLRVSNFLSN